MKENEQEEIVCNVSCIFSFVTIIRVHPNIRTDCESRMCLRRTAETTIVKPTIRLAKVQKP